jgi:DNA-binding response OmpR family regulator
MADETIVLVDTVVESRQALAQWLAAAGWRPRLASPGDLMQAVEREGPGVVLLAVEGPGGDTVALCRALRARHDVPLVLLAPREDDPVVVRALAAGADDVLVRPLRRPLAAAKIQAHVRRYAMGRGHGDTLLKFRDLEIDMARGLVRRAGDVVALTRTEYRLLVGLARRAGRVCTSSELFEWLWRQPDGGDARSIQVHVSNLRKKLEPNPARPRYVLTVRGQGYKFNPDLHRSTRGL